MSLTNVSRPSTSPVRLLNDTHIKAWVNEANMCPKGVRSPCLCSASSHTKTFPDTSCSRSLAVRRRVIKGRMPSRTASKTTWASLASRRSGQQGCQRAPLKRMNGIEHTKCWVRGRASGVDSARGRHSANWMRRMVAKLHHRRGYIGHGESEVALSTGTETGRSLETEKPGFSESRELDMAKRQTRMRRRSG